MLRFYLNRTVDVSGISGEGRIAEGVVFSTGKVVLQWIAEYQSTAVYDSMEDLISIHGHEGSTQVEWVEADGS